MRPHVPIPELPQVQMAERHRNDRGGQVSVMATSRPASTKYGKTKTCGRCGILHTGRQEMCRDCMDVERPKTCMRGHQRTEGNVYTPSNGRPQCGACKRVNANTRRGWEWSCQACGRAASQGEVLCKACGPTPANDMDVIYTGGISETAPGQVRQHLSPQGLATIQLREPHRD